MHVQTHTHAAIKLHSDCACRSLCTKTVINLLGKPNKTVVIQWSWWTFQHPWVPQVTPSPQYTYMLSRFCNTRTVTWLSVIWIQSSPQQINQGGEGKHRRSNVVNGKRFTVWQHEMDLRKRLRIGSKGGFHVKLLKYYFVKWIGL
jgi:hypothetical protein